MARSLNGISEAEYLQAVNKSLEYDPHDTRAADNYRDPGLEVDTGREEPAAMEFKVEESAKPEKRYKRTRILRRQ